MSLDEATLKGQLGRANEVLAARVKVMDANGVAAADRRKDAVWRQLNAACNTIRTRLKAVAAVKAREEEVAKRKAEKLAAPAVEKESKKAGKEPKAAKDKGAGGSKKADGKKSEKAEKAEKGGGAEPKEKKKKE